MQKLFKKEGKFIICFSNVIQSLLYDALSNKSNKDDMMFHCDKKVAWGFGLVVWYYLDFSLQLPTICHLFFRAKRSFSKIKSSLSVMTNEGFADIQAKSAEKVQEKLSKLKRFVK